MDETPHGSLLTVRETASRLGVHENTIRNWAKQGLLTPVRLPRSGYMRFREEDVEELRRERRPPRRATPPRPGAKPNLIDAADLAAWPTQNRRDAEQTFPELIRRLLVATPGVTGVSVRAGDGISAPGWDGRATSAGASFLPAGALRLELGTGETPGEKARDDYAKRRDERRGDVPSELTFVFMTPRRWPGAHQWADDRTADAHFAAVRALDADDLEGWLIATPAVHVWISEHLGRRPREVATSDAWWRRYRERTQPPLPAALLLAGRDVPRTALLQHLEQPPDDAVTLHAATQDEAVAFVAVALETGDDRRSPALVISSHAAWSDVVGHAGNPTLVPLFRDPDIATALAAGHHVVLPAGRDDVTRGAAVALPPPDRRAAAEAFQMVGVDWAPADELAALARRSMPALVRRLSRDPRVARPPWSRPPSARTFAPLMLAGAWTVAGADVRAVERIAGQPVEAFAPALADQHAQPDPVFVKSGGQWHLASPYEAFLLLRSSLVAGDLERWHAVAGDVLVDADPRYELPPDDRPMAALLDGARSSSSVLRRGLAQSAALMSVGDDAPFDDGRTGPEHARTLVRTLLRRAARDETGRIWRGLHDVLPLLAEAAPDEVLDAVHADLDTPAPLLRTMFQDTGGSGWLTSSPHTGLLWALETLCWSADLLVEAADALARLAVIDPGGALGNRPHRSLANVLVSWRRHTSAPVEVRIVALERICSQHPDVGWTLVRALWPRSNAVATPPSTPRFRDWTPDSPNVPLGDRLAFVDRVVSLAVELAGSDLTRWAALVRLFGPLPASQREVIIAALEEVTAEGTMPGDGRGVLWESLQAETARHRRQDEQGWALDAPSLVRLDAVTARLGADAGAMRFVPLFEWRPELPGVDAAGDREAYHRALDAHRTRAVADVLVDEGLAGARTLAVHSRATAQVGLVLGATAPEAMTPELLEWLDADLAGDPEGAALAQAAGGWAARKIATAGIAWLRSTLELAAAAPPARRERLVLAAPPTPELWDALPGIDPALELAYWRGLDPFGVEAVAVERAASTLLTHGRPWQAIDLLAAHVDQDAPGRSPFPPDLVVRTLRAAVTADIADASSQSVAFEVGLLLDHLEAVEPPVPTVAFELAFFELLEDHRPPRALTAELASEPSLFVELVSTVYRGAAEEEPAEPDEARQRLARPVWAVLAGWDGPIPGQRPDGTVDAALLTQWVDDARRRLAAADRTDAGDTQIGEVLASSPEGHDGAWPAEPVRDLIESLKSPRLEHGFEIGAFNRRGVTSRGVFDGGALERQEAAKYRAWAATTASRWRRTTRILRNLAETFERDARREDDEARVRADTE